MKLPLLILLFAFSIPQIQCTTKKYTINDDNDETQIQIMHQL